MKYHLAQHSSTRTVPACGPPFKATFISFASSDLHAKLGKTHFDEAMSERVALHKMQTQVLRSGYHNFAWWNVEIVNYKDPSRYFFTPKLLFT